VPGLALPLLVPTKIFRVSALDLQPCEQFPSTATPNKVDRQSRRAQYQFFDSISATVTIKAFRILEDQHLPQLKLPTSTVDSLNPSAGKLQTTRFWSRSAKYNQVSILAGLLRTQ
jgi:hypothetical protein